MSRPYLRIGTRLDGGDAGWASLRGNAIRWSGGNVCLPPPFSEQAWCGPPPVLWFEETASALSSVCGSYSFFNLVSALRWGGEGQKRAEIP